ncbi:competence protein ComE [Cyanobacterium stanieri LEGE 03274]|uniref:phospholipase D n=1 Tax=Cyanobacterium stanieri LEGE 03274 TaxID=1828756 RepID=A0ABR9V4W6_9CHRO|nr:phospholipase D-like domain-containing protein [Cyanobacterium stanieri]MBE9222917.1 competence protein ComE [Cyanobacterium stanieri LEGE 03274]
MKINNILTVILPFSLILYGCQNELSIIPINNSSPLPQDVNIQVYFNHNQQEEYNEPYRPIIRAGDNLEKILIEAVNSAEKTIDIAVQELNLPDLARAVVTQHQAGKQVRIIIENNYNLNINNLGPDHGLAILKKNNVAIIDDTEDGSKGSGLMHHKFMIIDNKKLVTGSANFTVSGTHGDLENENTRGNANHLLVIDNAPLAIIFTEEFNYMWGDGVNNKKDSLFGLQKPYRPSQNLTIGDSQITVKFSPTSRSQPWENTTNGLIDKTLNQATESIDLALFVFSKQPLSNSLENQNLKGTQIRALIDPLFAYRYYSEGLDLLGVELSNNCQYYDDNNPWKNPLDTVGIPNIERGDKLHHKFALIDNKIVITGSHNWSAAANYNNDESLLIIDNTIIAEHFRREFDRLYEDAILGITDRLQQRINEDRRECRVN